MKLVPMMALSLGLLTGCGTVAGVSTVMPAASKVVAKTTTARGPIQTYGSFFKGRVTAIDGKVISLSAVAESKTPGCVRVFITPGLGPAFDGRVGDLVSLFIDYTLVDTKTREIVDKGIPYQASIDG